VIKRLFEKAYPLLGPLDADSVAKQRSNVPNLRSSKRVQTRSPRLQPVFLAPLHSILHEGLCSPMRMRGLLTTPLPPRFSAHLRYRPSSTALCRTSEVRRYFV
ncbi:hypothetical protein KC19_2G262200, partial [Ceratodon purpureus]